MKVRSQEIPSSAAGLSAEAYRSDPENRTSRNGAVIFSVSLFAVAFIVCFLAASFLLQTLPLVAVLVSIVAAWLVASSAHIALQWERVAVLRLGRFNRVAGPGLYFTIPIIESCTIRVDQRIIVTPFGAEQTLTSDLVPINVDAVLFWMVWDTEKACTEVEDYRFAVTLSAQTALRDAIGRGSAASLAIHRTHLDKQLQKDIEAKVADWGTTVISVEIRDIIIPDELQKLMSVEAQAERQKYARISLMEAERDISEILTEISDTYGEDDKALRLRMMHLLYDSIKETGGTVVIPSSFSEGFNGEGLEDFLKTK